MPPKITQLAAREILDSRGLPTVEAEVRLSDGTSERGMVPAGASTGRHEALELRDGDAARYGGRGVRRAVANVRELIAPALAGVEADPAAIDARLRELDGTPNKSRLGANAILGVSLAVVRAGARSRGIPLYRYIAELGSSQPAMPLPMVNILSGGLHTGAGPKLDVQDYLAVPRGAESYSQAIEWIVRVHTAMRAVLDARGYTLTGVADEGGWAPALPSNRAGLELMVEAIERAGLRAGDQIAIALDIASTHFFRDGHYELGAERRNLSAAEMVEMLAGWAAEFPVVSIEDGLAEDDWSAWPSLTVRLGSRCQIVGDDLFTTNAERLARGIRERAANAVLVKMNQIGTITETLAVVAQARAAGFRAVISARSGETEDDSLADLAVGTGAGQIKVGSITRSERLAKYNRLFRIEEELWPAALPEPFG